MFMRLRHASVENYFEDVWTIYVFDLLVKHRKLLMFATFKQTPWDMIPAVCVGGRSRQIRKLQKLLGVKGWVIFHFPRSFRGSVSSAVV